MKCLCVNHEALEKVQFVNGKRQMVNEGVTSSDCVDNVQTAILRPCGISYVRMSQIQDVSVYTK